MAYHIGDYLNIQNSNNTRIEVVPNRRTEEELLSHYLAHGLEIIPIWEIIPEHSIELIMPNILIKIIMDKSKRGSHQIVVKGLSEYFSLIDPNRIKKMMNALKEQLEIQQMNCIFIVRSDYSNEINFSNPKYSDSLQYVVFAGIVESTYSSIITILPSEYVYGTKYLTDFNQLLKKIYDDNNPSFLERNKDYYLSIPLNKFNQSGLADNVIFVDNIRDVAAMETGNDIDLTDEQISILLSKCHDENKTVNDLMSEKIMVERLPITLILRELLFFVDDPLWDAILWYVKQKIDPKSYLYFVLKSGVTKENILHQYIVDSSLNIIENENIKKFSAERSESLKHISENISPMIKEFISRTRDKENAIYMLNCNSDDEKIELIRRLRNYDLSTGIPSDYANYFPELKQYLSYYDYGSYDVTQYFREYRINKIKNTVPIEFVKKALEIKIPDNISSRDEEIAHYHNEKDACLLVVDGLGAEYMPYLMHIFSSMNYNIEKSSIVFVKIPTSTEYNHINWENSRIAEIKNVDNIAHNGVYKNESNSPEHNLVNVLLNVFNKELLGRIAENIANYSKVIITSDHGTSRLAVIAHENGLSKTISINSEPNDWRFTKEIPGESMPDNMEKRYDPDKNETYWVVRGYNRLQKSGGKKNELHGGATLEERLVPFIVLSGHKSDLSSEITDVPQMKEKDDFDI